jgi:hypothetical protein
MDQLMTLQDEPYRTIERSADGDRHTPDSLVSESLEDLRDPRSNPRHYETDDWFRHLGMSDETIQKIKRSIRSELECPRDADA